MKKIIGVFALISFSLVSCGPEQSENCHRYANLYNNTSKRVYFLTSTAYPDTTVVRYTYPPILDPNARTEPFQANARLMEAPGSCVESFYDPYILKSGVLMLYVFDGEVLETTPWKTIVENNMYLKRYDLTLLDLKMMNFTIVYNGD